MRVVVAFSRVSDEKQQLEVSESYDADQYRYRFLAIVFAFQFGSAREREKSLEKKPRETKSARTVVVSVRIVCFGRSLSRRPIRRLKY
eukprot:scaffold219634_cov56-Attheya_sp.AAC.1